MRLERGLSPASVAMESLLGAVRQHPWILLLLAFWALRGRAFLRAQLARRAAIDASVLPYDAAAVQRAASARESGRAVWLVTRTHQRHADAVAAHLGGFEKVLSSDDSTDLSPAQQMQALDRIAGPGQYELDRPGSVHSAASPLAWLRAFRVHQWSKNALIFVPLITSHELLEPRLFALASAAFLAFGLVASSTYILNDLFDLAADRHHPRKRRRPFASGELSAGAGLVASLVLLAAGLWISLWLPAAFVFSLLAYLAITLLYSFRLKRVASLDVVLLAGLYTLRVVAGGWATGIELSFWLLAFSMFIFLCLAFAKRVAELIDMRRRITAAGGQMPAARIRGREYGLEDIPILQVMGASSGYLAVLVLALYIDSPDVATQYGNPHLLWLIAPLMLLWVTRLWLVTTRGYMNDDPVVFAIKDPETWVTAAVTALILVLAAGKLPGTVAARPPLRQLRETSTTPVATSRVPTMRIALGCSPCTSHASSIVITNPAPTSG